MAALTSVKSLKYRDIKIYLFLKTFGALFDFCLMREMHFEARIVKWLFDDMQDLHVLNGWIEIGIIEPICYYNHQPHLILSQF